MDTQNPPKIKSFCNFEAGAEKFVLTISSTENPPKMTTFCDFKREYKNINEPQIHPK